MKKKTILKGKYMEKDIEVISEDSGVATRLTIIYDAKRMSNPFANFESKAYKRFCESNDGRGEYYLAVDMVKIFTGDPEWKPDSF